ncbi:MAG: indole-3-glycerol phosphate synthase TrpC [Mobilitalea sp.]
MILETIAASSLARVKKAKELQSQSELIQLIEKQMELDTSRKDGFYSFERMLQGQNSEIAFICEVKKASPSKGIISEEFPYIKIAKEYEEAGASAISVLTEPEFFLGSDRYLREIKKEVKIPVLRKDFTVDEYQIYEAKLLGADAILLICTLLNTQTLKKYLTICKELGLSALVEAHTKEEIESAMEAGAKIIGVNNRNLKTFEVDINNSIRLREYTPKEIIFVAESGIRDNNDIKALKQAGVNAVLIGETLMRSPNKKEMLSELKGLSKQHTDSA